MKAIIKITSIIISLTMFLNCLAVFAAEDIDVEIRHISSWEVLNALGIVDEELDVFDESTNITRAEFIHYVMRLMGFTNTSVAKDALKFSDVPVTYWAAPDIVCGESLGIISGYANGEFGPEDWLTYEQAVKIILAAIGHTNETTFLQSYPHSYVLFANSIGLLDNVEGTIGVEIKKGDAVEMIYNALDCEVVIQYMFGTTNKYNKNGTTMLEEYWNIRKIKGVFNATEQKNAYGLRLPGKGLIEIDRVSYCADEFCVDENLLFNVVEAYVKKSPDGKEHLIYMRKSDGKSIEISTDDIDNKSGRNTIYYYADEKLKNARIDENASVLLNGKYYKAAEKLTLQDLNMPSATVYMYDSDKNNNYDILNFKKYETYVVERIDAKNNTIFLKYDQLFNGNSYIELETRLTDQTIQLRKNGEQIGVTALNEWDVLDVYQTYDGLLVDIDVVQSQTECVVKSIMDEKLICEDGAVYKLSDSYKNALKDSQSTAEKPQIGTVALFHLNGSGEVAAITNDNSDKILYAYLIAAGGETKAFETDARVKLFNQNGEMLVLNVAERIILNGKKGVDYSEFLNYTQNGTYSKNCVVKYSVNKAGELNYLDTPDENVGSDIPEAEKLQLLTTWEGELDWTAGYNLENSKYRLTDKTVIFSMPADLSNDKGYRVIKNSDISVSADHGTPAKFDLYDANDVYRVGAAVYYGGADGLTAKYAGNLIIVNEIIKILDDDDNVRTQIIGLETVSIRAGEGYTRPVTFFEAEPGIFDNLTTGSVFMYKLNADGEVTEIREDYSPDKNKEFFCSNDNSIQSGFRCYGRVEKISYSDKMILVDAGKDGKFSVMVRAIATYDEKEGSVVAAPLEEIRIGDIVYLNGSYFHPGITIIHRYMD